MKFKKGDRVLHKNLQLKGTFVEYDWTGDNLQIYYKNGVTLIWL